MLTHLASVKLSLGLDWNNQSPRMCVAFLPPSVGVVKSKGLTHLGSAKLSLDLDWNNQSPRMCVAFLPPSVGVVKSKGLRKDLLPMQSWPKCLFKAEVLFTQCCISSSEVVVDQSPNQKPSRQDLLNTQRSPQSFITEKPWHLQTVPCHRWHAPPRQSFQTRASYTPCRQTSGTCPKT